MSQTSDTEHFRAFSDDKQWAAAHMPQAQHHALSIVWQLVSKLTLTITSPIPELTQSNHSLSNIKMGQVRREKGRENQG